LIVIGAFGVGLAGAGVVGGALLIKVLKGNQGAKNKKETARQPPEQKEDDKLLGYELRLSAEKLKISQGAPAQLGVTAVAQYSRSGYRDAPGVAIAISLPPAATAGLQVVPLTGLGRLLCNISLAGEVAANQVVLTVTGQASGWQDEVKVIVEIKQDFQVEFF